MAKMFTYIMIMSVIMLLLYFGGVLNTNQLGGVSDIVTTNATTGGITLNDWQNTNLYQFIWGIGLALAAAVVVGIAASFFGGVPPAESFVKAAQVFVSGSFLFSFVTGMWNVINKVNSTSCSTGLCGNWVTALVVMIMVPIALGYIWSTIEWISGSGD